MSAFTPAVTVTPPHGIDKRGWNGLSNVSTGSLAANNMGSYLWSEDIASRVWDYRHRVIIRHSQETMTRVQLGYSEGKKMERVWKEWRVKVGKEDGQSRGRNMNGKCLRRLVGDIKLSDDNVILSRKTASRDESGESEE